MADAPPPRHDPHPGEPPGGDAELSGTVIGRGTAAFLAGCFILILAAVPLLDAVLPALRPRAPDAAAAADPHPLIALLRHPPALSSFTPPVHRQGVEEVNPLQQAESALDGCSLLRGWGGALVRAARCALLRSGSPAVAIGAGGWLYYRPAGAPSHRPRRPSPPPPPTRVRKRPSPPSPATAARPGRS
jgi:hypothetical protein